MPQLAARLAGSQRVPLQMSDNEVSFGGAALACNSTLEATRWLPGSHKPVSRRINDSKVARIKAGGLRAVYCNPGEH